VLGAVLVFLLIQRTGGALDAPDATPVPVGEVSHPASGLLLHLLIALGLVMAVGRAIGRLFRSLGQPPVIGEVVGGILLGPSLLGWLSPGAYAFVLPTAVTPVLGAVAQLGVILYMFLVGLDLNPERLRNRVQSTIAISHSSIVAPFVLGAALALFLYPRFSTSAVPFTSFALFVGVAMSITAFPVLARILADRGLTRTEIGALALTCAAIADVTSWCLLAFVVGIVQADTGAGVRVATLTSVFILLMFVVARPVMARIAGRLAGEPGPDTVAFVLVALLASALSTEAIGVHALFGAFLFGAVIPHESRLAGALHRSLSDLVTVLLLPAFFASTGMRTEIGLLTDVTAWLVCGLIVVVATVGKFGGTFVAARLTGIEPHSAAALGVLMNTRGLMELIVLNVGFEMGVISPTLFTMFVIMALATTLATTPIVARLMNPERAVGRR
jgi:Kef-type K+ transport system membrane component KefB